MRMEPFEASTQGGRRIYMAAGAFAAVTILGLAAIFVAASIPHAFSAEVAKVIQVDPKPPGKPAPSPMMEFDGTTKPWFSDDSSPFSVKFDTKTQILTIVGDYNDMTEIKDITTALGDKVPRGILLKNSNGGLIDVGYWIGEYAHDHKVPILAEGYCVSACGYAWLGAFSSHTAFILKDTVLPEHMPYQETGTMFRPSFLVGESSLVEVAGYFGKIDIVPDVALIFRNEASAAGAIQDVMGDDFQTNGFFDLVDVSEHLTGDKVPVIASVNHWIIDPMNVGPDVTIKAPVRNHHQ